MASTRQLPAAAIALLALLFLSSCTRNDASFRHDGHVTITKGACGPCHGEDPANPRPATTGDCAACHRQSAEPGKAGRYGIPAGPVRRASTGYGDLLFSHGAHSAGRLTCPVCHAGRGKPGFPAMAECIACHETEGGPTSCRSCHRKLPAGAVEPPPPTR